MRSRADVVVIGAGVQGLSAAYHLAKLGVTDVVVVEKECVGAGSSSRSASMLMLQVENEGKVRLSQSSYREYMRFQEETGHDPEFKRIGCLWVATEEAREETARGAETRRRLGVRTDLLSPGEVKEVVPALNVEDIVLGVLGPDDGVINANSIMQGYCSAAQELGASVEVGRTATGIRVDHGAIRGVETDGGPIEAPTVVNAAGAEAAEVGRWVGLDLPIQNRARSIYLTGEFPQIPDGTPFVEDAAAEWYFRKEGRAVLMGMGREETRTISMSPNLDFLPEVVEFAIHRAPVFAGASVVGGWSGFRPLTPDSNPILGPVEGVEGFINQCGWGGEGVMHAPAGGSITARYVAGKPIDEFEMGPFLLSRFDGDGRRAPP
ncbi:MAG: FAD-binding oxidoreductase [Nitrososphaerales archaeon]|jgi:sarcosine oxidase subunit beta